MIQKLKVKKTKYNENLWRTINLKNILERLKLNIGIFRRTIYLFNPKQNKGIYFQEFTCRSPSIVNGSNTLK